MIAATAAISAAIVTAAFAAAGFWWFDGATTTRSSTGRERHSSARRNYFLVANLAAAIVACGPAVIAAMPKLRDRPVWVVVGGALACIVAADISQYSKAEVERIWLIFYPWLVPACVALARRRKAWILCQGLFAIALQAGLVSKW